MREVWLGRRFMAKKKIDGNVKEQIIKAYVELCYEKSNNAVTLQLIADQAGVAFSTVRYYFAKERLLLEKEAIEYTFKIAHDFFLKRAQEARENESFNPLMDYIDASFVFIEQFPHVFSYTMYFYYLLSTNAEFVKGNEEYLNTAIKRIEGLIYESIGRGFYKTTVNIPQKAKQVHTLLYGNLLITFTQHNKKNEYDERLINTKEGVALIMKLDQ